jgi:hypothetical protein
LKRTLLSTIDRDVLSILPVAAEPVNATADLAVEVVEEIAAAAAEQLNRAGRKQPDSIIARKTASVRYDVTVAGLTMAGIPASSVGASFSNMPHTGS